MSIVSVLPGYPPTLELASCFSRNCSIEQHNYQECKASSGMSAWYIILAQAITYESHSLEEQSLCKNPTHSFVSRK